MFATKKDDGVLSRIGTAVGTIRRGIGLYTVKEVSNAVNYVRDEFKQRATVVEDMEYDTIDKIVRQPWPYSLLKLYAESHPFLVIVHGSITRSIVKNHWESRQKFAMKCPKCGTEFKEPVTECSECGKKRLKKPSRVQKALLDSFIKDPNRDDEMRDIIESLAKDALSTGNCYTFAAPMPGKLYSIYVEDSSNIEIAASKTGRKGNGVYFCSKCFSGSDPQKYTKIYTEEEPHDRCEKCGGPLTETAYVHRIQGGEVDARFGLKELIHINADPWLPKLYGRSKVAAVLLQLRSALAMDQFNFGNYALTRMAQIICLLGSSQDEANKVADAVAAQELQLEVERIIAERTGRPFRKQRSLFLGSKKGIEVKPALPDSKSMQSLEWMEYWLVKIVAAVYGVQPMYINIGGSGPGGYFQRMQVVVQAETTQYYQELIERAFNDELLPQMGITDWEFKFNPIEPRDERQDAQIWREKIAAGQEAANAGLTAVLTDEGELKISGEFKFQTMGDVHARHIENEPPAPGEPRQDGDEGLIPGSDQGSTGGKPS